jgi:predicted transcriptional regulator
MTTMTIEIDKERDLPVLQALLDRMGLAFEVEDDDDDDWGDLSEAEIEEIKAGLADIEAGRTYSHEHVMVRMEER